MYFCVSLIINMRNVPLRFNFWFLQQHQHKNCQQQKKKKEEKQ